MASKILVVDDNAEMREIVHMYLSEAGFDVITACDGQDGLYLAIAEQPDLILSDIKMPNIDGIQFTENIRSNDKTKNIPIIIWTSLGSNTPLEEAIRAGANRAINKPTHFETLIDDVQEVLAESRQPSQNKSDA
jgi:CheY-like chemotaxis protein